MTSCRRLSAVLLGFVVLGASGCSSEERPERADTVQAPSASQPSASGTASENAAADTALTPEQAQAALLTVQDLPTGWSTDPSAAPTEEDGDDPIQPEECAAVFRPLKDGSDPLAKAEANFSSGGLGPVLQQTVTSFEDDAADRLQGLTDALGACPEFSLTDSSGVVTTFVAAPLSFPNLGDRSLAVRLRGSNDTIDVTLDVVYVAVGRNAVSLVTGGLVPMPGADLEAVGRRSVERLDAAAAA